MRMIYLPSSCFNSSSSKERNRLLAKKTRMKNKMILEDLQRQVRTLQERNAYLEGKLQDMEAKAALAHLFES